MANTKKWMVIVLIMIGFLSSCKEEYVFTYTNDFLITQNQWRKDSDDSGVYYYCEIREPNLTQFIYDYGVMQAFLKINNSLTPLPFDDFWVEGDYQWTEQVTCEFRPGFVTFILKYSDHAADDPYYDYDFRVRFMWNEK